MLANANFLRFNFIEPLFHLRQFLFRQMPDRHGKEHMILFVDMKNQQCNVIISMAFKSQGGAVIPVSIAKQFLFHFGYQVAALLMLLEHDADRAAFRADLFHRLNVYPINVPALRKRKEEIPLLAGHFCERIQRRLGLGPVRINPDSYETMTRYEWPGNVRELENTISRAVLKASFDTAKGAPVIIFPSHLGSDLIPADMQHSPPSAKEDAVFAKDFSFNDEVKAYKRKMIRQAIDRNHGNWAAAARDLNMHRSNLHNLAKRLGLKS